MNLVLEQEILQLDGAPVVGAETEAQDRDDLGMEAASCIDNKVWMNG